MTPQEQELVNELFDRLAKLESNPRDADAGRLIADGPETGAARSLHARADSAGSG